MESFASERGEPILGALVAAIQARSGELSDLDGALGDGDHGINMAKGFGMCLEQLSARSYGLSEAFSTLGGVLLDEIGGAMGPLYGTFFRGLARASKGRERIDAELFGSMLEQAIAGVAALGGAKAGDKTLLDTLEPALAAYRRALSEGKPFSEALGELAFAAERGRDSTREMAAKVGRASRLGERSRGSVDAGAASACVILCALAASMRTLLEEEAT